jgi:hypothetical protein
MILYATYELCEFWYKGSKSEVFDPDEFNKNFVAPPLTVAKPKLSQVSDAKLVKNPKEEPTFD